MAVNVSMQTPSISGSTLEEKYKEFVDQVGHGFTKVLADALAGIAATAHAQHAQDPDVDEILKIFLSGPQVHLTFPTPTLLSNVTQKLACITSMGSREEPIPETLGGSLTVGGSWTF